MVLVNRSNQVVRREELFEAVWPGVVVEENNLTQQISILRKTLGDEDGVLIETIPRIGYRLNVSLAESSRPFQASLSRYRYWIAAGLILISIPTAALLMAPEISSTTPIGPVAVLPFLSDSPEDAYVGYAISEALTRRLSSIASMIVRPLGSAQPFVDVRTEPVEAGRKLRVQSVVSGTVRRSPGSLVVVARLTRVDDGAVLWSQTLERPTSSLFDIPDEIFRSIAGELDLDLESAASSRTLSRRTPLPEAYEEYVKGRYLWNRRNSPDFSKAAEHFRKAIAIDPSYAAAYAGLSDVLGFIGSEDGEAEKAIQRALALDDTLAEAHASRGLGYLVYDYDFPRARKEFERAIELDPGYATAHHWFAYYWAAIGQFDRALAEITKARRAIRHRLSSRPITARSCTSLADTTKRWRNFNR